MGSGYLRQEAPRDEVNGASELPERTAASGEEPSWQSGDVPGLPALRHGERVRGMFRVTDGNGASNEAE